MLRTFFSLMAVGLVAILTASRYTWNAISLSSEHFLGPDCDSRQKQDPQMRPYRNFYYSLLLAFAGGWSATGVCFLKYSGGRET